MYNFAEGGDAASWNVLIKIAFIALFIMLTSPTSTHALMQAGFESGIEPEIDDDESESTQEKEELETHDFRTRCIDFATAYSCGSYGIADS